MQAHTRGGSIPINIAALLRDMQRNPFFMPSGFTLQEKINIAENRSTAKRVYDKIRERKRAEKKILKLAKMQNKHNKGRGLKTRQWLATMEIQRGRDLAKQWGYDGIDRTYHPVLMKAR